MDPNDLHHIHPAHPPYASQENINSEHQHTLSPGIYQPSFPNSFQHCHSFQSTSESAEREILSMTYSPQVTAPASSSQTIPIFPTSSLTQAASGSSLPFTQSLAEHTRSITNPISWALALLRYMEVSRTLSFGIRKPLVMAVRTRG